MLVQHVYIYIVSIVYTCNIGPCERSESPRCLNSEETEQIYPKILSV